LLETLRLQEAILDMVGNERIVASWSVGSVAALTASSRIKITVFTMQRDGDSPFPRKDYGVL
jgi:hypothetical protein